MSHAARSLTDLVPDDLLVAPSAERWRAMSQAERDAFLDASLAALQRKEARLMEGRPHSTAKITALQVLRDYFDRIGRTIYLASELPVHYPEERIFAPDLMAVRDVEDTWQDDQRMAWVVTQEGRGLDLVLEILHAGDPQKDLLENVQDYARMGIPEYFVYDRRKGRVHGFRLSYPGSGRYDRIAMRGGTLSSRVLGLDLGMVGERLRFSTGGSEILETREINERINAMLDRLELKSDAEAQRADAEAQRADAEAAARAEAEGRAAALEQRLALLLAKIGEG